MPPHSGIRRVGHASDNLSLRAAQGWTIGKSDAQECDHSLLRVVPQQVMFESFENVSFEPNGASSVFDPGTLKQTCYQSYQNLKNQEPLRNPSASLAR
jgi:hypothetical protein